MLYGCKRLGPYEVLTCVTALRPPD